MILSGLSWLNVGPWHLYWGVSWTLLLCLS